ncbi:MAG TPA: chloride channel protein, partial [Stellaceae bacterium]|nr:chloride channel protein [Stellaceae bacterium]
MVDIAPAEGTERTGAAVERVLPAERRLRDSELFLLALALAAGVAAGVGVVFIDILLDFVRWLAFAVGSDEHLIDVDLGPARVLAMPVLGGLLVGLTLMLLRRWRPREIVDAIEANALLGGRMSVFDSLGLAAATLLSGGFGASVGMEAAYTQLGAALASRLGRSVELRRD